MHARQVGNTEILSKLLQKAHKQEISVNLSLDIVWQLVEKILVGLVMNGRVRIVVPPVVKEAFDPLLHFDIKVLTLVKLLDEPEESGKIISFIKVIVDSLERVQNVNEVTHNE